MTDFEVVFGLPPSGPADRTRKQKELVYAQDAAKFEAIVEHDWPAEALALYAEIGIGMPVAYQRKDGTVLVAFPEAMYHKLRYVPLATASEFPGVVWRTWHMASVAAGWHVPELNQNFPASVVAANEALKPAE